MLPISINRDYSRFDSFHAVRILEPTHRGLLRCHIPTGMAETARPAIGLAWTRATAIGLPPGQASTAPVNHRAHNNTTPGIMSCRHVRGLPWVQVGPLARPA